MIVERAIPEHERIVSIVPFVVVVTKDRVFDRQALLERDKHYRAMLKHRRGRNIGAGEDASNTKRRGLADRQVRVPRNLARREVRIGRGG